MLTGKKISLRALEPADADLLYEWENNTEIWRLSNTLTPFSLHTIKRYIDSVQDIYSERQQRLVICIIKSKKPIGCIDLFDYDPLNLRAGVGILISDSDERGKGYASEALKLMINYAFQHLRLHQLYCNIPIDNKPSIKLFKNLGFKTTAKKKDWNNVEGRWMDEYFLQLINPS